jgi:hypothetical protein
MLSRPGSNLSDGRQKYAAIFGWMILLDSGNHFLPTPTEEFNRGSFGKGANGQWTQSERLAKPTLKERGNRITNGEKWVKPEKETLP